MSDFRPISLCNVAYKILPCLISHHQSAFMPGRLVTDNAIVAFEIFHAMKRQGSGRHGNMAINLDMNKAYDKVEWIFLERVMYRYGF